MSSLEPEEIGTTFSLSDAEADLQAGVRAALKFPAIEYGTHLGELNIGAFLDLSTQE